MNLEEASKVIAYYLVGGVVAPERLRQACEAAAADRRYRNHLATELGLDGEEPDLCQRFAERVAEFIDMSAEERRREMPEAVAHLPTCPRCRSLYWEVKPLWVRDRLSAVGRTLSEGIHLALNRFGRLLERGLGPPALEEQGLVAITAGPSETPLGEEAGQVPGTAWLAQKEWRLPDEELQAALLIKFRGLTSGGVTVTISLEGLAEARALLEVREVRETGKPRTVLKGSLEDLQPFNLGRGSWRIRVQAETPDHQTLTSWEIPLELTN